MPFLTYHTVSRPKNRLAERGNSDDCSGWDCLGDAAQFGIILVVVAVVLALVYLYWRLKIKPNLRAVRSDDQTPVSSHWEVSRTNPNQVSIKIYREPRRLADPEVAGTESRTPRHRKRDNPPTQNKENITNRSPKQLGAAGALDVHWVPPPPPPPVFWTTATPSVISPPPPFGPPAFLAPIPPPAPLQQTQFGTGTVAVPCPPYTPPPYASCTAPQNLPRQYPGVGNTATFQPACAPPPVSAPTPLRNSNQAAQGTPPAENHGQKRRWFSLGTRLPAAGHARTLSDSSSSPTLDRFGSPSSPVPSVSLPTHGRGRRDHSRRPPARRQPPRQGRQLPQNSHIRARDHQHHHHHPQASPSPSESSLRSSYVNTSVEAVYDNQEPHSRSRHHAQSSSDSERSRRQNRRRREDHLASFESFPLSSLHRQRLPSSPGPSRRASPDLQFPSPEPHRARVSFTLPSGSDEEDISSSQHPGRRRYSDTRSRGRQGVSHGDMGSRRSPLRQDQKKPGLADRITGTFYRMRRALRGEN